jgi:glucose-1-phosphatase
MSRTGIQLVCFDLGRVLVRICDGWQEACRSAGVSAANIPPARLEQLHQAVRRYELGHMTCDAFFSQATSVTGLDIRQVRTVWEAWTCSVYDGTELLLDRLRSRGVKLACLSNTNASHWRVFHDPASHCFLPMDRFDHRFASHLVGLAKPDAAIYAHVEQQTQLCPPQIAFFDDLEPNVLAARQRGWHACHVAPAPHPPGQVAEILTVMGLL